MTTQDIVDTWRREAIQEGVKQGLQEGVKQGLQEGVKQGLQEGVKQGVARGIAASLLAIHRARFGLMPDDLRAAVEDTRDEEILRGWLDLALAGTADTLAAAIRAARTS